MDQKSFISNVLRLPPIDMIVSPSFLKRRIRKNIDKRWRYDTQHNDTQHDDTQNNDTQHDDTQHNDTQYNEARRLFLVSLF